MFNNIILAGEFTPAIPPHYIAPTTQESTQEETARDSRSSIDTEVNMLYVVSDCITVNECDEKNKREGSSRPEDHDNHCG